MLLASELKGELARIHPARLCCRRAELTGLLFGNRDGGGVRTLDHATARVAVELGGGQGGLSVTGAPAGQPHTAARHHLHVPLGASQSDPFVWAAAPTHDRRAFLRGVVLGSASISFVGRGPHLEFVFRDRNRAEALRAWLADSDVRGGLSQRRGRHVVYLKGQEEIASLLRLTGANRSLLDFETGRVGRDVRNRLNRLLNAEEANLGRTVRAADRQLRAIEVLELHGTLPRLAAPLREVAALRRAQPDADLDRLAGALGIGRSAVNHRLRRLVKLAAAESAPAS
ncbi:MAG TPA: DNA-binding protein WhiA [Candidatus Limnocylindria bacterium]|nr:DNA-binding protein WhiA [Candidatus Limnocylindria bacterium]